MMKIGIGIGDIAGAPAGADGLIAQAKRAEADGFASGWFANIMGMDEIMAAARWARETGRIELGTAVVPTFPRHPHAMAQQALSAQAIAGGRFTLGIGLSHQIVIEGMLGLSFAKPYSHMKEYLAVLGPLIRSGSVSHWGNEYRVMLDREGAEGPADVAIVGDESAVGEQLRRLAEAGATDFLAAPFAVPGDGDAVERTRALLAKLAPAGVG